jgi:hypothetical protein
MPARAPWQLNSVGTAAACLISSALATLLMVFMVIRCETPHVAGVNDGYFTAGGARLPAPGSPSRAALTSACNTGCVCCARARVGAGVRAG